jgi:hypothetical protein
MNIFNSSLDEAGKFVDKWITNAESSSEYYSEIDKVSDLSEV